MAWAQRTGTGQDARIVVSTSSDSGKTWSAAAPVDGGSISDDSGNTFARGHQFMPQLTFASGRLMLVYYDQRLDHTLSLFKPNDALRPGQPGPVLPAHAGAAGRAQGLRRRGQRLHPLRRRQRLDPDAAAPHDRPARGRRRSGREPELRVGERFAVPDGPVGPGQQRGLRGRRGQPDQPAAAGHAVPAPGQRAESPDVLAGDAAVPRRLHRRRRTELRRGSRDREVELHHGREPAGVLRDVDGQPGRRAADRSGHPARGLVQVHAAVLDPESPGQHDQEPHRSVAERSALRRPLRGQPQPERLRQPDHRGPARRLSPGRQAALRGPEAARLRRHGPELHGAGPRLHAHRRAEIGRHGLLPADGSAGPFADRADDRRPFGPGAARLRELRRIRREA